MEAPHQIRGAEDLEAFRELLDSWLTRTRTSQAELSRRSGVPQNVISRWLGANPTRPSPRNLERLAPVIGHDYEDLMKLAGYLPGEVMAPDRDPDLIAVEAAWPRLSNGVREAIKILVGTGPRVSSPSRGRVSSQREAFTPELGEPEDADDGQNGLISACKRPPQRLLTRPTLQRRLVALGA